METDFGVSVASLRMYHESRRKWKIVDPDRCISTLGQSHGNLGQQSDLVDINATFPPSGPMRQPALLLRYEKWVTKRILGANLVPADMGNEGFGEPSSVRMIDFGVPVASPRTDHEIPRKWKVLQNLFTCITVIRRFGNKYCSKSFQSYLADAFQTRVVFQSPRNSELWKLDLPGSYLDELSLVHRDLKASNVLLRDFGELEDWSSSSGLGTTKYMAPEILRDFGELEHWSSSSGLGTTKYMAPEILREGILREETVSWQADVYSFAMTCYEVITGEIPFSNMGSKSYPCKLLRNKEQRKFQSHSCDQEWRDYGHSQDDVSNFTNGECGMKDLPVNLVPLGSIQLDGSNGHRSQANHEIEVNVDTKLKGEPAQAIMDDSAASCESQAEVPSSRSLPFIGLFGLGGMGKSTLSNEVKRAFLKKHDEEDGDVKNAVSAVINGGWGIEAMEEQTEIVQMDADLPVFADLDELCDESDSETEEFDMPSEDESAASRESQAEVTSDGHVPQTEPSQNAGSKRSAASAFGEGDLIAEIGSSVNKQIEGALQPLMWVLRSWDEDEQRHREKMLAIEKEKRVLKRQNMVLSRILAHLNAIRASPQICPIPDLNTEMPVPHVDVKGEDMAKPEAHDTVLLESDKNRLKLSVEDSPPLMKLPKPLNQDLGPENLFMTDLSLGTSRALRRRDTDEIKLELPGGRTKDDMHSLINESGARQMGNLSAKGGRMSNSGVHNLEMSEYHSLGDGQESVTRPCRESVLLQITRPREDRDGVILGVESKGVVDELRSARSSSRDEFLQPPNPSELVQEYRYPNTGVPLGTPIAVQPPAAVQTTLGKPVRPDICRPEAFLWPSKALRTDDKSFRAWQMLKDSYYWL